ncbi:unnamed protein product [Symbiodinium necroappetens]|uniref:Uncharacterized protein n=1 Tax=Symbiodinium necroappetens TaxID=1628268 RepID=A0A812KV22_9DINO|nr:unnamed protein product [Symbiodinium necroappetens]
MNPRMLKAGDSPPTTQISQPPGHRVTFRRTLLPFLVNDAFQEQQDLSSLPCGSRGRCRKREELATDVFPGGPGNIAGKGFLGPVDGREVGRVCGR